MARPGRRGRRGFAHPPDSRVGPRHPGGRGLAPGDAAARRLAGRHPPLRGPLRPLPRSAQASLERGEPIVGDPDRPLNLVHIADAATASVAALDRGQPGRIYLVSDDRPLPRRAYYTLAAELLAAPPPQFVPPAAGALKPFARRRANASRTAGSERSWVSRWRFLTFTRDFRNRWEPREFRRGDSARTGQTVRQPLWRLTVRRQRGGPVRMVIADAISGRARELTSV